MTKSTKQHTKRIQNNSRRKRIQTQSDKNALIRRNLGLEDTRLSNTIARMLLQQTDGNIVRAKLIINRYVQTELSKNPTKSRERIILDYRLENNKQTPSSIRKTKEGRQKVPNTIIYMTLNKRQPKLK